MIINNKILIMIINNDSISYIKIIQKKVYI